MLPQSNQPKAAELSQKLSILCGLRNGPMTSKDILSYIQKKQSKLYIQKYCLQNSIQKYLMSQNMVQISQLFHAIGQSFIQAFEKTGQNLNWLNTSFQSVYIMMPQIISQKLDIIKFEDFEIESQAKMNQWSEMSSQVQKLLKWTFRQLVAHFQMTNYTSASVINQEVQVVLSNFQRAWHKLTNQMEESSNTEELLASIQKMQVQVSKIIVEHQCVRVQPKLQVQNLTSARNHQSHKNIHHLNKKKPASNKDAIKYSLDLKLQLNQLLHNLHGQFTNTQKQILEKSLKQVISQWQKAGSWITGSHPLAKRNSDHASDCIKKLQAAIARIKFVQQAEKERNINRFVWLVGLFSVILLEPSQKYHMAVRFLQKLCKTIEGRFEFYQCRKILSIFQNRNHQVQHQTKQLQKLYQQLPLRSPDYKETTQSKFHKANDFANKRQAQGLVIPNQQDPKKSLKIVRLNYCAKPTKNIIILISGFLSQYSPNDVDWQGIISAHKHTQIFGLIWPSHTYKDIATFLAHVSIQVAQHKYPLISNVASGIMKLFNNTKKSVSNPFFEALNNTGSTGRLLAECLIKNFADRKVTLVGFSMGTEVIRCCLDTLADRNSMEIIHKVVTIGGIAKTEQVEKLLMTKCGVGLRWVNFWSKNDYAVCWVFWLLSSMGTAVGAGDIPKVPGHQIINYEMQNVNGHCDFRNHLGQIYEKSGLKYD